jgi:hypothetical protein
MSFVDFAKRYMNGTLEDDVTWRAYDIPAMVKAQHYNEGRKIIGFATYESYSDIGVYYDLPPEQVKQILGLWVVWCRIVEGRMLKSTLKEHTRTDLQP